MTPSDFIDLRSVKLQNFSSMLFQHSDEIRPPATDRFNPGKDSLDTYVNFKAFAGHIEIIMGFQGYSWFSESQRIRCVACLVGGYAYTLIGPLVENILREEGAQLKNWRTILKILDFVYGDKGEGCAYSEFTSTEVQRPAARREDARSWAEMNRSFGTCGRSKNRMSFVCLPVKEAIFLNTIHWTKAI